jgi:hypothetical protein
MASTGTGPVEGRLFVVAPEGVAKTNVLDRAGAENSRRMAKEKLRVDLMSFP